ncbi:hypothetical protein [Amycolatopsis sp. H20-H5]|uniref:hypothetical protein n=1 Tax=Amycolatopsis sp. H20-H5 TaxID=3046309 RepID=UPI002DBBE452|nr:hypothetical protein [Amycolatopsis sp. H20-H5]MEC3976256.1 hypothetical protein [Amycolatopsis sp. H20-H5]
MRIRVEGTETETAAVVERLTTVLEVQESSRFYVNRGDSVLGRVYLTVAVPPATTVVHANAERTDRARGVQDSRRKEIR